MDQRNQLKERLLHSLEEAGAGLREAEKAASVNEIKLLLGKLMTINHSRHESEAYPRIRDSWKLFAQRNDSTLEIGENGVYIGIDHIRAWYEAFDALGPTHGTMFAHNLASPQIVVADDGETARGVWHCPGHETDPRYVESGGSAEGFPAAVWNWGRIRADFIRENGEWRTWHYHFYSRLISPFHRSWTDHEKTAPFRGPLSSRPGYAGAKLPAPDAPTTAHNEYDPETIMYPIPPCPEPYATWTADMGPA